MAQRILQAVLHSQSASLFAGARVPYVLGVQKHFSTTGGDPDSHSDFQPISKAPSDVVSARQLVEKDVKENPVMLYIKGVPDAPRCGFSALAVRVFQQYGVPFSSRNILEDAELKEGIKAFSNWPTFPQIFIKGEFVGGSDIILNMHQSGELKEKLKDLEPSQ
uniref:TSA: Wollemia nobilis Ref_Wollemi_Transcript_15031_914 transcribed RNA sequence n=1 Tax=Wollemia nobilis TaxID=56998 RepID=A0A0C9RSK7_9CONI